MNEVRRFSLIKPTLETPFSIDFDWWKQHDNNWRVFLYGFLCPEHQSSFNGTDADVWIDYVDPETAEIRPVDGLQNVLMTHCARQEGFLTQSSSLVDTVFRVLLANGNEPMNVKQLGEAINRPAETILRTLSGMQVYKGIRPRQV